MMGVDGSGSGGSDDDGGRTRAPAAGTTEDSSITGLERICHTMGIWPALGPYLVFTYCTVAKWYHLLIYTRKQKDTITRLYS